MLVILAVLLGGVLGGVLGTPSVNVPKCSKSWSEPVIVQGFSSGDGDAPEKENLKLCWDEDGLHISGEMLDDPYMHNIYKDCNSPLFKQTAAEHFLARGTEDPITYLELDVAPSSAVWVSTVFHPDRNGTMTNETNLPCSSVNVKITTDQDHASWSSSIIVPWTTIPLATSSSNSTIPPTHLRGNFYRIHPNENLGQNTCEPYLNGKQCDFLAWSPTYAIPPAFHWPTHFGHLILV